MDDCIFCKIASGAIPSKKVYEDDLLIAFHDIAPQAPVHVLVVPKKHISGVNELTDADLALVGHVYSVIRRLVRELKIDESGYRVVVNSGKDRLTERSASAFSRARRPLARLASGLSGCFALEPQIFARTGKRKRGKAIVMALPRFLLYNNRIKQL